MERRRRRRRRKPAEEPKRDEVTPEDIGIPPVDVVAIFDHKGCTLEAAAEFTYRQMNATRRVRRGKKTFEEPDWANQESAVERRLRLGGHNRPDKQEHSITGSMSLSWEDE